MTIEWLVENFLPNYKIRFSAYCLAEDVDIDEEPCVYSAIFQFALDNTNEALENFAKAQRKQCVDMFIKGLCRGYSNEEFIDKIENAPIPQSLNND